MNFKPYLFIINPDICYIIIKAWVCKKSNKLSTENLHTHRNQAPNPLAVPFKPSPLRKEHLRLLCSYFEPRKYFKVTLKVDTEGIQIPVQHFLFLEIIFPIKLNISKFLSAGVVTIAKGMPRYSELSF